MLDWLKATGCVFALFLGVFALSSAAQAGPEDGRIVNGSGSISQSGTHTDIRQNSDFLATHWGSFNIAAHESVQAHQPAASSRLLIRVDGGGGGATNIAGNYTSNGITILENRNGVQFSRGAIVNVGGLLATSSRISGVSGANWQLNGTGGAVVNHGQIAAGAGGVVLAAVRVENHGKITAQGGDVALGAGSAFTVDFAGSLVGFEVKKAADGASVVHDGVIESQGGIVSLSAQEAQAVRTNVVSVGGVVKATRIERRGGVVYLSGGTQGIAEVSGDVSASDKVQTTGEYVVVKEGALLKAPEILVGGDFQGGGDVPTSRRTLVERGALLDAGAEGRVIVWSDETTWFNGDIAAPGGFAEVSGKETLASVNLAGIDVGELLLDPATIMISTSAASASAIAVEGDIAADDEPPGILTLAVASINDFEGDLSLAATTTIVVNAAINKQMGNLTLSSNGSVAVNANINNGTNTLTLIAGITTTGAITSAARTITAGALNLTQTGAFGATLFDPASPVSGNVTLRVRSTAAQTIHPWMASLGTGNFSLQGEGVTLASITVPASFTRTGDIDLRATLINLTDITTTGNITLHADNIDGSAIALMATNGDITLLGAGGSGTPTLGSLGSSVTSVTLRQNAVFGPTAPFTTIPDAVTSLTLETGAAQTVQGWMVGAPALNRALSVTSGGVLTIASDINIGEADLTLSGASIALSGAATLTGAAITITAPTIDIGEDRALAITASGALTLATVGMITGTGTAALSLEGDTIAGLSTALTLDVPTVSLELTIASTVDPGGRVLVPGSSFGATAPFAANSMIGTLNINTQAEQEYHSWMAATNRNLSIDSRFRITIGVAEINLGNGDLTLSSPEIDYTHASGLTIRVGDFSHSGTFQTRFADFISTPLLVFANGNITLETIFSLSDRLELRADADGDGMGMITSSSSFRLDAGSLLLQHAGVFAADLFTTASRVSGAVTLRVTGAGVDQTIHPWMVMLGGTSFSLAGEGVVLDSITLPAALTYTGAIDLQATTLNLNADTTLTGAAISLTGAIDEFNNFDIIASGVLTLNSDINLGTGMAGGILTISAGRINVPTANTDIDAMAITINFTDPAVGSQEAGFTTGSMDNVIFMPEPTYIINLGCVDPANCVLGNGSAFEASRTLSATASITINTGTEALTFSGTGPITISAPMVMITAGDINIGTRALTITASNGSLTLNADIRADAASTAAIMLIAINGPLTLVPAMAGEGDRTIGGPTGLTRTFATLTLSSTGTNSELVSCTLACFLGVAELSLTQTAAFGGGDVVPYRIGVVPRLNLTTSMAQTVQGWMITTGRSFSLTTTGMLTLNNSFRADQSNDDITLSGSSIVLGGTFVSIRGRDVTLRGAISTTLSSVSITAGSVLTISDDINVGTGTLTLISGAAISDGDAMTAPTLTADTVSITQGAAFGETPLFTFADSVGALTLVVTAAATAQTVYGWMVAGTNRALSLTTTGVITISSDIDTGTGDLTLSGTGITLGNTVNALAGNAVSLTGAIMRSSSAALTVTAAGVLRINNNVNIGTGNLTLSGMGGIMKGTGDISLIGANITITGGITGTRGALTIGSATILLTLDGNIDIGTGDLTLNLGTTATAFTNVRSLSGNAVTIGGAGITSTDGNLAISALGNLVVNAGINVGANTLRLEAGRGASQTGSITFMATEIALIAAGFDLTQDGAIFPTARPATFRTAATTTAPTNTVRVAYTGTGTQGDVSGWAVEIVADATLGMGASFMIMAGDLLNGELRATSSITLNAGTAGEITFATGVPTSVTLTAPMITITALTINIGANRTLTIIADGGTLMLTGVRTITSTGTASLSLTAEGFPGLRSDITVNVPTVSLASTAIGSSFFSQPFSDSSTITTLSVSARSNQIYVAWMGDIPRNLILTSDGSVTVNENINLGTGSLTLNGGFGIALGASVTSLAGGAVSLGAVRRTAGSGAALTITATGDFRLNGNIDIGTGDLTLSATRGFAQLRNVILTGAAITLTGALTANNDLTINASGVLTLNNNINVGTGDLVIDAMGGTTLSGVVALTADNITLTGGITSANNDLIINATTLLTLNSDINAGTGNLTLNLGTALAAFTNVRSLSGNAVTITGAGILSADGDLTISALGNLAVNAGINVGANALLLEAGRALGDGAGQTGSIVFGDMALIFRADNFALVQDGALFDTTTRPAVFQDGAGMEISDTGNPSAIRLLYDGTETQAPVAWAFNVPPMISLGPGSTFEVAAANFTGGVLATTVSITLNAGTGTLTFAGTGDITLRAPTITITAGMINIGTRTLTLTTAAGQLTLNLTAGMTITGTGAAALSVSGDTIAGLSSALTVNVPTVNLELTGADSAFTSRPFLGTSQIDTLTITTAADQTYLVWMAPPAGTNRNLTITSAVGITINSTAINLGTGNLTLTSDTTIRLTNMAGLTITAGDVTFSAGDLRDGANSGEVVISQLVVVATGDIAISSIVLPMSRVELRADGNITIDTRFRAFTGSPGISANILLLQQAGAFAEDLFDAATGVDVSGAVNLRVTGMGVDQTIHPWMTNLGDGNFSLRGEGVALTSITTTAALTRTGTINLRATAITLGGALTGGVVALRTNTITVPGANLVAIHATAGDITAITITDTGGAGQERPTLTTSATSLSLEQTSAFGGRSSLPFTFDDAVIGTALTLSTRSEQLVRGWMIRVGRNLTITSSDRVLVDTAIGAGNRNLGGGDLTLTSTGGAVRIFADITTTGNLILIGGAGGINFNNRAAKTLSGAAITLTGNALSNRALIITATSGALTLSGAINTGTSALTLSGSSGIALGGALTLTGGSITLSAITGAANLTITTSSALTLTSIISLTGTSILALRSGQGAITGTGSLTASTVRLRQFAAFADTEPFIFTNGIGSLLLITDANQDVHDWMIALNRNLTVRSSARVRVDAAIGSGNRNLGTGSLTLRSTGGIVRILADISTTGSLTLIGPGAISNGDRVGANRPALTASTVSFTQDAAFATTGLFRFGAATGSLEFTTTARQDVHNWMIRENTNLTVTSSNRVRVLAAIGAGARNLGTGSLTLTSTGGDVRIVADITTTGDVTLDASGILTISSDINIGTNALTLTSGGAISNGGNVGANRPLLTAGTVSFTQDAAFATTGLFRFGAATGSLEFTTTVNQDVHNWMIRENTNLTVTSSNRVRVLAAIGSSVTGRDLGTGVLTLTSTGRIVRIVADIATTGDVTLTASGILTISSDIDIGANALTLTSGGAISNGGNVGANRPTLTASTVSFRQDAAFATTGPFRFGSATGSLVFTTTVNQDVHNWMIRENTNLTVTSSDRVRVLAAIGMDEQGRNLGNGSLTLTSTGRIVRIVADISTTGDATITASSILTINNDINIGTGALTLTGASFAIDTSVDLAAGSHSFTPDFSCTGSTTPSCTVNAP